MTTQDATNKNVVELALCGLSTNQIADITGLSRTGVFNALKKHEVAAVKRPKAAQGQRFKHIETGGKE